MAKELVNRLSALSYGGVEWLKCPMGPLCGGLIAWSLKLGWYVPSELDSVVQLYGEAPLDELDGKIALYIRGQTGLSDLEKVQMLRNILDVCIDGGGSDFSRMGLSQYLRNNFDTESSADRVIRRAAWVAGKYLG